MPAKINLAEWPQDEKPHLVELGEKHNLLTEDVNEVTGKTVEHKTAMHAFFKLISKPILFMHGNRFNAFILSGQFAVVLWIFEVLGVDTKRFGPLINHILDLLIAFQP